MSYADSSSNSHSSGGREDRDQARRRAYTLYVSLFAAALVVVMWLLWPPSLDTQLVPFVALLVIGIASVLLKEVDTGSPVGLSFTSVVLVSAAPVVGPTLAGVLGGLSQCADIKTRPGIRVFNVAMATILGTVAALAYRITGGWSAAELESPGHTQWDLFLHAGFPLAMGNLAVAVSNLVILSVMVRLSGRSVRQYITGPVGQSVPLYLGYALLCFIFVVLWLPAQVGPLSAVLILAPLLVARWIFVQYGDEVRAHTRVLATLVTAAEGSQRVSSRHGERVDAYCAQIARRLRLTDRESRSLHYAATLHDIGRIGVSHESLAKRAAEAGPRDLAELRRHPEIAEVLIKDIDFLRGAASGVRHHHERFDGRGYPDALVGAEIPLLARIIAVADGFDALTHPLGSHPPLAAEDAIAHLRRRVGTQFDGVVVEALAGALAEGNLSLPPPRQGGRMADELWWDHDDPTVSELVARQDTSFDESG